MLRKEDLVGEIRINEKYAHLYTAEYEKTLKGESTPIIKKKALLTQDYLRRMTVNLGQAMTILPANCRYVEKLNKGNIVVIEEPPAYRTVRIRMEFRHECKKLKEAGKLDEYGYVESDWNSSGARDKSFNLALPYVVFVLYLNSSNQLSAGQVFFRAARMIGLSDYLLKAPFTNIADNQYICFGSNGSGHPSLNGGVEAAVNNFWAAQFNTDYMYNYHAYKEVAGISTYMEWAALSQIDPMFIYNVQWIKIPMNIGQAVDEMKRQYNLSAPTDMQYRTLSQMFSRPLDTGRDIKPTKRARKKHRLYFDVAEGTFLDDRFYVHVGDPFMDKQGRVYHINSLISFMDSGDIRYIRLERQDGRLILFKLTKACKEYLRDKIKELRYETEGVLKNGVVIKEGDILQIKTAMGNTVYKKVTCIRKMQNGTHEGQFGDGFYILENTEAEIFDVGKPKYKGITLNKKTKYLYFGRNEVPYQSGSIVKYTGINTDRRGQLQIEMHHVDKNLRYDPYRIPLGKSASSELLPLDQARELPPVFRCGRKLFVIRHNSKPKKGQVHGTPQGIVYESAYGGTSRPTPDEIKDYLMGDDQFKVSSFDMDIEFSIGDKVVAADWENPINMLSVKIIQGFKFDQEKGDVHFILGDKHGNLHQVQYVNGQTGSIFVGRIRKIDNEYGGIKSGTKIKAKEAGIPHFPKKDTNIIIGFITDTDGPEPLVLCSNCCTLWFKDVVKRFSKMTMKAKKWATTPHAPIDISKIKYQAGDVLIGTGDYRNRAGWLVFNIPSQKAPKIIDFEYYVSYPDYYSLDRYMTANSRFDCIPNPRFSVKERSESDNKSGWPNLHGHFFTCKSSRFQFVDDERSLVDVQSSPE